MDGLVLTRDGDFWLLDGDVLCTVSQIPESIDWERMKISCVESGGKVFKFHNIKGHFYQVSGGGKSMVTYALERFLVNAKPGSFIHSYQVQFEECKV